MRLSQRDQWLLTLAHPAGPQSVLPCRTLKGSAWTDLFECADRHGVLPAVIANIQALDEHDARPSIPEEALKAAESRQILRSAQSLQLRRQARDLGTALTSARIPFLVLKGCEFADRLYPRPSLRTYTDVDLLIPRSQQDATSGVMVSLGYAQKKTTAKHSDAYGETVWHYRERRGGAVEVHWNLVNSPLLQKSLGFTFEDLQRQSDGCASPASLLLTAVVHAASSHAFDRLGPLCDIALAARSTAGPLDLEWLRQTTTRPSVALALTAGLRLAEELLQDEACATLRKQLQLPSRWLWRTCLSAGMVLRLHARRDSFRRQAFRQMLKGK